MTLLEWIYSRRQRSWSTSIRSLDFDEKPKYSYLCKIFCDLFVRESFDYDHVYDWTVLEYLIAMQRRKELSEYSFIDAKTGSSSFSMHSVLHHWYFHTFEENKGTMSWLALIIVASAMPSETVLHYSLIQRRLQPHCDHVYSILQRYLQEAFKNREYLPSLSDACHQLGNLYSNQDKMKEAEDMYLRALAGKEKAWGPEHKQALVAVLIRYD